MRTTRSLRAAVAITAVAMAAGLTAIAPTTQASDYTYNCPKAERLINGTNWSKHQLSKGVTLKEGQHKDNTGYVKMHVLSVDLSTPHISVRPVFKKMSFSARLSYLATGLKNAVAVTNTGYFAWGPPRVPLGQFADAGHPYLGSTANNHVLAFDKNGLAHFDTAHLDGKLTAGTSSIRVSALNTWSPPSGITVYNVRWGAASINLPRDAVDRYVTNGKVSSSVGSHTAAPTSGQTLIVARGSKAQSWLKSLRNGAAVKQSLQMAYGRLSGIKQSYAVGAQLVVNGKARTNMLCRTSYKQPARTAVGVANGGKTLIIVVVEDDPGVRSCATCGYTPMHGVDQNQLAKIMHDLGAYNAFLWDGSGSSEMLAKIPGAPDHANCVNSADGLSCRNYPADGAERWQPLGIGIFHS